MNTLLRNLHNAVTGFDMSVKDLAVATHEYAEDIMASRDLSLNLTIKEIHELIQEDWGVSKGRTTLRTYYTTCAWLIAEAGELSWVEGRTFNQHRIAANKQWTLEALQEDKPRSIRNGYKSENPVTSIKRAFSTLIMGEEHLKVDAEKRRGGAKKMAEKLLKTLEQVQPMSEEFQRTLNEM